MSSLDRDVFLSLLALDAYNRGYDQSVITQDGDSAFGQNEIGRRVGLATITGQSDVLAGQPGVEAGFYAIAYSWNGETVVSYRGTSFDGAPATNDILNGWSLGAGFSDSVQAGLAVQFYKDVTGLSANDSIFDTSAGNTVFTGHSLGGGLAGYVGALAAGDVVAFDHMPFLQAAFAQSLAEATSRAVAAAKDASGLDLELSDLITLKSLGDDQLSDEQRIGLQALDDGLRDAWDLVQPQYDLFRGYYLDGEVNEPLRALDAAVNGVDLTSQDLGTILAEIAVGLGQSVVGIDEEFSEDTIVSNGLNTEIDNRGIDFGAPGYSLTEDAVGLHSMSLLTVMLFGERQWAGEGGRSGWQSSAQHIFHNLSDPTLATGFGLSDGPQLNALIAYSAINEGTRVFGDTGIRALFNDADDLGSQLTRAPNLFDETTVDLLGLAIAEFAGLLAVNKMDSASFAGALGGVVSVGDAVPAFTIATGKAYWSEFSGIDPTLGQPEDYVSTNAGAVARDLLLDNLTDSGARAGLNSWLLDVGSELGAQANPLTPPETFANFIDVVSMTYGGGSLFRDPNFTDGSGFQLFLGVDTNPSDGNGGGYRNSLDGRNDIVISGDGGNHFLGLGGDDALITGAGEDILDGGAGDDLIAGGRGADQLSGGSGDDIIWSGDLLGQDDNAGDRLTGGAGADKFYVGNGDTITDPGRGDSIFVLDSRLTGGEETDVDSNVYVAANGGVYNLADDGTLTFSLNPTITIQNFRNGDAGIRLIEAEDDDDDSGRPDFDDAERPRDPLIIDLDGDQNVITARSSVAAYFDLDNDGFAERVSWARSTDGFLVRDLDGNGLIESGSEMFGTGNVEFSAAELRPFGEDGFLELAQLDSNIDGAITAADVQFAELKVWVDANLDAITDEGELVTLESLGIVSISLSTFNSDHLAIVGDSSFITRASTVGFDDGSTRTVYDAYLSIDQYDAREVLSDFTVDERFEDLPFLLGSGDLSDLDIAMTRDAGLAELVSEFSALEIENAHQILARTQQILLRWTGADQVAPDTRGPNVNAQWLHALEVITGDDFVQASVGRNPRADAGDFLLGEWQSLVSNTAAKLVGQTTLGETLTPGLSFRAAAFFTVDDGATVESVLAAAVANQPAGGAESIGYWASTVEILGAYRTRLPIEDGIGPLASEFDARLSAVLAAVNVPFSLEQLRDIFTVSEGEDSVLGRARNFTGSADDVFLIQDSAGRVDGGAGDDTYIIGRNVGSLDLVDENGRNELFLADSASSEISVGAEVDEGRTWLRITDTGGTLDLRIQIEVTQTGIDSAVDDVRFADGTSVELLELVADAGVAFDVILAKPSPEITQGTAIDDLIIGVGGSNAYLFERGGRNDSIIDTAGETDRIIVSGNIADIDFFVDRNATSDDLILRFSDTGETLRILGHHSDLGQTIEEFEFDDGVLSLTDVDALLNTGTSANEVIIGSRRDDVITGLAGNDDLRGEAGQDTYRFDLGWGDDRLTDASTGNRIEFGPLLLVEDITAERGGNDDLVLRSSAGDSVTIVGGLRSAIVTEFSFADGTIKSLSNFVEEVAANENLLFVSGTAGDDRLIGGAESDTFVGNGGNDTFIGGGGLDRYIIEGDFTRVNGSSVGIDTLVAPDGAGLFDLRFDDRFDVFRFGTDGPVVDANSLIDFVLFDDGAIVDLTGVGISTGTDGNDFLYSTGRQATTFRSGSGDDIIIGSTSDSRLDTYEFEVGFGDDVIYDLGGIEDRIVFLSPELSVDNATLEKVGSDLVISFASGDTLTIEGHYWNHSFDDGVPDFFGASSGSIERFRFGDGRNFLGINSLVSSVTDGDDLVMSGSLAGLRDGGAGNDILFGGREQNVFVFSEGYGHDAIQDQGGSNQWVRFNGLEPEDVTITRDPTDPFSIVFTIIASGETLTIDGTPDDEFLPDDDPRAELTSRGLSIQEFIFDSATLTDEDVVNQVFASEVTDGDDVIDGLNSSGEIRLGLGSDRVNIGNGRETVIVGPDSGSKVISYDADGSRPGSASSPFNVLFEGASRNDLAFREINEIDGVFGRHLEITGGGTTVTIINGADRRFNQVNFGEGVLPRISVSSAEGEVSVFNGDEFEGPLLVREGRRGSLTVGTDGSDILQGSTSDPEAVIDPGSGNDIIFGLSNGAGDTVRFDVGYGVDRYLGSGGPLTVVMGDGLTASDIEIVCSKDEPGLIELSVIGTQDKLLFEADDLSQILVGGETIVTSAAPAFDPATLPTFSVDPGMEIISGNGDELIVSTGGSATITITESSGADFVEDARFEAALASASDLAGWSANSLTIEGVTDADQLRFIIEDTDPNTLIIEMPNGDRTSILNQFGFGIPEATGAFISPDLDGDGTPDWQSIDFDGNGTPDFDPLDTNGDGAPDWLAADFDGDGASDWVDVAFADASFASGDVFAEDLDFDGNFDFYFFETFDAEFDARDVDGDGVADEYRESGSFGTVGVPWTPAPTNSAGDIDWSLLDLNGNGVSDLAGFADGTGPGWLSSVDFQATDPNWTFDGFGELYDQDGNFIADREFNVATGEATYFLYPDFGIGLSPASDAIFLARDFDGDGIADVVGVDLDDDFEADPTVDATVPTVVSSITLSDTGSLFSPPTTLSLADIIPLIELVAIPPVTVIDLDSLKPIATEGADDLVLGTGEEIDSLGGNDMVTSFGEGGVFRWSAGDGNDVFRSTLRVPASQFEPSATALDTIRFDGILDLAQLRFFASESNPSNLVIEIIETGEQLTLEGQLGATSEGAEAAPPVGLFELESGLVITAGDAATLAREPAVVDESQQTTDNSGGLLDGGAGGDEQNELLGGTGDDIYLFGRDYGEDMIVDAGGTDTVQFGDGITRNDLFFSRTGETGEDLLVEVLGLDRLALTITGQFGDEANRIENFAFADGSRLDWRGVQEIILDIAETGADDSIIGFTSDDIIRGGRGNDALTGAGGDDQLFGGEGRDQAVFSGAQSEYMVTFEGDVTIVTDTVADRDGVTRLDSVEELVFLGDQATTLLAPENIAPSVSDLQLDVAEDGTLVVSAAALVAAASDANGDELRVAGVTAASNGQVWIGVDGDIRFLPDQDFAGDAGFDFSITDGNGAVTTARASVTVVGNNDAPRISIEPQAFTTFEDNPIDWVLPAGSILDPDGDTLTIEARLVSGEALPDWLSFDGARFSGTPPTDFNGVIDIEVTADDGNVVTVSAIQIDIIALNDAPRVVAAPENISLRPGESFAFALSAGAFIDPEGDPFSLAVTASDGSPLPDWITVNGLELSGTVPADLVEPLEVAFVADDGQATSVSLFEIIPLLNQAPELNAPLPGVSSAEDQPVNFAISADTFVDPDGDTLELTASLSDGSPLPDWLSFDGINFTGTPPQDFNGLLDIAVTASDGDSSVSDTFTLAIDPVNDAPIVAQVLNDAAAAEDTVISIGIPAAAFADVDGDSLTLSATLTDGSDLPAWLDFDGATFTGTPPQDFNGVINLSVTASDGEFEVAQEFALTIDPVNDVPFVLQPLEDLFSPEDTPLLAELPSDAFADVDGDTLTLSATLADGSALPTWLTFDGAAFAGNPPLDFNGTLSLTVQASDGESEVSQNFALTIDPVNDAPVLQQPLVDQSIEGGASLQFALPQNSFSDVDGDDLSYAATLADGSALPTWLTFDGDQQVFAGTVPNEDAVFDVRVTASDSSLSVSDDFTIDVSAFDPGAGTSEGFSFVSLNSWYNSAWGGGYNVTFEYEVQPEAIVDGELRAWDILASYTGPGTIRNGWVNGFPGPASFEITADGAEFSTDGQSYQPELAEGQTFRITLQVDGAPYTDGDFGFEIFDRDPELNLADAENTSLTVSPTNDFGSGLTQNVSFTNTSGEDIRDWQIVLSLPDGVDFDVTNVWNATATKLTSGDYLFEAVSSNEEVAPGGQIGFGFNASYSGVGGFQFTTADFTFVDADARQFDVARQNVNSAGTWAYGTDGNDTVVGVNGASSQVFGALGDDTLTGADANDVLAGGSGDDVLTGLDGDDILIGGRGNDTLFGGLGFDTAQLFGYRESYSIITQAGDLGVRVTDLSAIAHGDDGIDQLSSIEQLMFRDGETLNIASPIILDLTGDGVQTVSASQSDALFDLDGDGLADDTSWISPTDAFLFIDRDGNGTMSGIEEISFIDDITNAGTDLDGLVAFDSNSDGVLNSEDDRFADFGVWQDADSDGAVDQGETASIEDIGIASIDLTGTPVNGDTEFGEVVIANTGTFAFENGVTREFADAALTYFSAATNTAELATTAYDFDRKAKKYRIHYANGVVAVDRKKRRQSGNSAVGQLGANTILEFDNRTFGRFAPVVLDLDGDGVDLVKRSKSGATFDYQGFGTRVDTGWISGGDGFLVVDRDGDGRITQGSELSLAAEDGDAQTGLQGLARFDSNGDGVVDNADARFGELRIWQDANENGQTDKGELQTLAEQGISSISLGAVGLQGRVKVTKNAITSVTSFSRTNGTSGTAADVSLAYRPATAPAEQPLSAFGRGGLGLAGDVQIPAFMSAQLRRGDSGLNDVFDQLRFGSDTTIARLFAGLDRIDSPIANVTLSPSRSSRSMEALADRWFNPSSAFSSRSFDLSFGRQFASEEGAERMQALATDGLRRTAESGTSRRAVDAAEVGNESVAVRPSDMARKLMMIRQDMSAFGLADGLDPMRDDRDAGLMPMDYFA